VYGDAAGVEAGQTGDTYPGYGADEYPAPGSGGGYAESGSKV